MDKKEYIYTRDGTKYIREDIAQEKFAPKKKRLQFSQKITLFSAIFSMAIVVAVLIADFILLWFDKQSMSEVTIIVITTFGGITSTLTFGGYCALSCIRDMSLNKKEWKIQEYTKENKEETE